MPRRSKTKRKDKAVHFNVEDSTDTAVEETPNILAHFQQKASSEITPVLEAEAEAELKALMDYEESIAKHDTSPVEADTNTVTNKKLDMETEVPPISNQNEVSEDSQENSDGDTTVLEDTEGDSVPQQDTPSKVGKDMSEPEPEPEPIIDTGTTDGIEATEETQPVVVRFDSEDEPITPEKPTDESMDHPSTIDSTEPDGDSSGEVAKDQSLDHATDFLRSGTRPPYKQNDPHVNTFSTHSSASVLKHKNV